MLKATLIVLLWSPSRDQTASVLTFLVNTVLWCVDAVREGLGLLDN